MIGQFLQCSPFLEQFQSNILAQLYSLALFLVQSDLPYSQPYKHHLKRHVTTVHEEKRPYKCSFCDQYFKTEDGVKNHSGKCVEHLKISPKLGPGERACCIQCDKTYINKSALRQHVEVVHLFHIIRMKTSEQTEMK